MITLLVLVKVIDGLYSQAVNIPLDNPLSYLYVILNAILQLFALLT